MTEAIRCCANCKKLAARNIFIRLIHIKNGIVLVKQSKKHLHGRSVYLCKNKNCFSEAKKYRRLEKALKISIPKVIWLQIENTLKKE